jgi:hypothetical protein
MDWTYHQFAQARIIAGSFKSEQAYVGWQLRICIAYTHPSSNSSVDQDHLFSLLGRLRNLGGDTPDFRRVLIADLHKQAAELREELATTAPQKQRDALEGAIAKIDRWLAGLNH